LLNQYLKSTSARGLGALQEGSFDVVAVGACDDFEFDSLRACGLAFADVGAISEVLDVIC
jgi:hypothetical protein